MEDHILVHGTLLVTIYEIDKLHLRLAHKFIHKVVKDLEEAVGFSETASKLYATIDLGKARIGRTRLIDSKHSTPKWDESFHIYCAHMSNNISFSIKEDQPVGASHIGQAQIPIQELLHGQQVEKWLPILHKNNKPIHGHSKLRVTIQFFNVSQDPDWGRGIKNENFIGVPYTFFPQRNGCKVTLYQDAHVPNGFHPQIPLSGGKFYKPQRCWEDIFDAINNAKHFIYIAGWSIYTKILLIRDPDRQKPEGDLCLGEILKKKAKDGVRVLMLVWDDRTSTNVLKKTGIMQTHDEETEEYFYGSEVHCVLCPRNPDNGRSIIQDFEVSTMFTHHQKTVTVDCGMPNGNSEKRRVVSFVGGIDLCDGRYDTPNHSPFGTLGTTNKHDFHQPNFAGARIEKGGPRECWHDIHTRLEGPVAWDVLYNFEQRWWKQGGRDLLIKLQEFDETFIPPSPVMYQEDEENWSVQLFRSIDGGAAFGFPEDPDCAAKAGLVSGKDNIIDRSIQDGYINAIRRAKNFIYIENQYFLGSSFAWNSKDIKDEEVGASHLIPKEVSLKIVSKIAAKERFTVYIVIPMWPEGIPAIVSVQAILNWQKRTMEMMYKDIAQKLEEMGIQDYDLKEYLTFFCLGNREKKKNGEYVPLMKPPSDTDYWRAQESRRFMIYVHAKMMIVDDEYIIVGSANINQRSMDGARDSEIAMGAFQPHHLATKKGARGEVYGFRMGLWFEHLGILEEVFCKPESLECVRRVNSLSDKYWNIYSSATLVEDLPGHLLSYPVRVGSNGELTQLSELECFPDTKAPVVGSTSEYLPSILTT